MTAVAHILHACGLAVFRVLMTIYEALLMPFYISRKRFESEMAKRAAEVREQTMKLIGAELHDDLMLKLQTVHLYVIRVDRSCSDGAGMIKLQVALEEAMKSARTASSRMLLFSSEGDTLITKLEKLCQSLEHPGVSHIHFSTGGDPAPLPEQVETHIVRIVQELIQNAFKHSSAWHIRVRLQWQPKILSIEVEDDGKGFNHVQEYVARLKSKNNTLRMRTLAIGALIEYVKLEKGLMARVELAVELGLENGESKN